MKWRGRQQSRNVEDRRGQGMRVGRGTSMGCGGILLIVVLALLFGADPMQLLQQVESQQPSSSAPGYPPGGGSGGPFGGSGSGAGGAVADELGQFASVVLADTEQTWNQIFAAEGQRYREPTLVLFDGQVRSACGMNSAAVGPFYCPADQKVYIDLSFFQTLERRFGAPGDFAQAYVLAHEVGHHVQNLLGISDQVHSAQQRMRKTEANQLSVKMELQADCLAGVWAYHAHRERRLLEPGDVEEGLRAAAAIGDDAIQRQSSGYVRPESWTHGSSDQRVAWLRRGMETGDSDMCDTFSP